MTDITPAPLTVSKTASSVITQHYGVKLNSSEGIDQCGLTADVTFGIAQNSGVTGDAIDVAPVNGGGSSYVILGGTIASAALVRIHTDGKAAADLASAFNIGVMEQGGAVGELGVVRLGNLTVKA